METERLVLNIPKRLKKRLKLLAIENDSNITNVVIEAIEKYLTLKK